MRPQAEILRDPRCYTACYCEENVYLLCKALLEEQPAGFEIKVVFISNQSKSCVVWKQRASKREDGLVCWDYHVIILAKAPSTGDWQVYDLDSTLPFPSPAARYFMQSFRPLDNLPAEYKQVFRVVSANDYLRLFASDRRHMRSSESPDGFSSPPPSYPPIRGKDATVDWNLDRFWDISRNHSASGSSAGGELSPCGRVHDLDGMMQLFCGGHGGG